MVTNDLSTWQGMRARDPRRLILGSAQWGMSYGIANRSGPPSGTDLETMLELARDAGVRGIDTARAYGDAEARIGQTLLNVRSCDGWRVVTKLAPDVHEDGLEIGETLERVATSLSQSRLALAQDTLPTVLLHRFAHRHACGGKLWRTLLAERDAGRIGTLGVSAATPEEAWAALDDPDVAVLQVASSLLDLRLLRQGFFPRARELGRTVYVRSVFLQGVAHLEPDDLPAFLSKLADSIRLIRSTAESLGVPTRALYLAFAREFLPGAYPIVGCETPGQLRDLLADWTSEELDAGKLAPLVESLPTFDADAVDPSQWPSKATRRHEGESQRKSALGGADEGAVNQTRPPSIANMPR